jgi:hypothetical protein
MIHSSIDPQKQADIRVLGKIDDFFNRFKNTSTLHRCGSENVMGYNGDSHDFLGFPVEEGWLWVGSDQLCSKI